MRKLRVVGSTADHDWLILSNKPKGREGSHAIAIDKRLLDVLQTAVYAKRDAQRAEDDEARAERRRTLQPKLPPREIQRQLRAGVPPKQVAKNAEVDEDYVDQFYTPILYERRGVIADAQAIHQEKPRSGPSAVPLGDAVAVNLSSRYVKMTDEQLAGSWMATRADGEPWLVTLSFPFRGRTRVAKWRYDPRVKTVVAANKIATDFGWIAPGRRTAPVAEVAAATTSTPTAKKAAVKKPTAKRTVTRKPAAKRTAARKPGAKKSPARKKPVKKPARTPRKKPAARKATVRKSAARKAPARKAAARKAPARKPAARKATSRKAPARSRARTPARGRRR